MFERPAAWVRKRKGALSYCSRSCASKSRAVSEDTRARLRDARLKLATPEWRSAQAKRMTGPGSPAWKGGITYFRPKGNYIGARYVRCPPAWRSMARKDGYVMEHRLVMAKRLGRTLLRTEVVHHVNHDPRDNRPGNLELFASNGDHKKAEAGGVNPGMRNSLLRPGVTLVAEGRYSSVEAPKPTPQPAVLAVLWAELV